MLICFESIFNKEAKLNVYYRSYADLISQAIMSSPEQRLTLSEIYCWMINNVPYFSDKGFSSSSAGWKVCKKYVWRISFKSSIILLLLNVD
jgi:hypothetical protein